MFLRVLHVTPYFAPAFCYGGPPRSLQTLCCGLRDANVDQLVLTTTANGRGELPPDKQDGCRDIRVCYLNRSFPRNHFVVRGVQTALLEACREVDIVHVHTCWNYICSQSMRYCRKWGVPYVGSPVSGVSSRHARHRRVATIEMEEAARVEMARTC